MKTTEINYSFTITRNTSNGVQEVLTTIGWRSREVVTRDNLVLSFFNRFDGTKEVNKWKADCRLPQMKKSIQLNYA